MKRNGASSQGRGGEAGGGGAGAGMPAPGTASTAAALPNQPRWVWGCARADKVVQTGGAAAAVPPGGAGPAKAGRGRGRSDEPKKKPGPGRPRKDAGLTPEQRKHRRCVTSRRCPACLVTVRTVCSYLPMCPGC